MAAPLSASTNTKPPADAAGSSGASTRREPPGSFKTHSRKYRPRNQSSHYRPRNKVRRRDDEALLSQVQRTLAAVERGGSAIGITDVNHALTAAGRLQRVDDAMRIFQALDASGDHGQNEEKQKVSSSSR